MRLVCFIKNWIVSQALLLKKKKLGTDWINHIVIVHILISITLN